MQPTYTKIGQQEFDKWEIIFQPRIFKKKKKKTYENFDFSRISKILELW